MYRTCAFCNSKLDGDGGPSGLGVGRRLAFDEWKARLWVICPKCSRWNLAPLDDRLEQIEALARAANSGRVAAATEQVALIRWQSYDLVRVGKPRRMEFATWRYGERQGAAPRAAQVRRARHGRRRGPRGGGQCGGGRLDGRVRVEHAQLRADDVHRHYWPATGEPRRAADLRALRERPAPAGEACGLRSCGASCACRRRLDLELPDLPYRRGDARGPGRAGRAPPGTHLSRPRPRQPATRRGRRPSGRNRGRARSPDQRRGPSRTDPAQPRPGTAPRARNGRGRARGGRRFGAPLEGGRRDRRDRRWYAVHHDGPGGGAAAPKAAGAAKGRSTV